MALVYAKDGEVFWVPVQYPSGIWRVQKLIAGANGSFLWSEQRGLWMHVPSYRLAYTDLHEARIVCRGLIQVEHKKSYWAMRLAIHRHENQTQYILKYYETCKERR